MLELGLGETEPAEKVVPFGPGIGALLLGLLPGEPEPVEEVALLDLGSDKPEPAEKVTLSDLTSVLRRSSRRPAVWIWTGVEKTHVKMT